MKKDKKNAKRRIKKGKAVKQESFFGRNMVGGGGGGGFGPSHTNTIVVPNSSDKNNQQNNQQSEYKKDKETNEARFKENETKIKLLEDNQNNSLTVIPPKTKSKGPITWRKATVLNEIPQFIPIKKPFIDEKKRQEQEQQNTRSLNARTEYIIEPVMKSSVDLTDTIGGASAKNTSDTFTEEVFVEETPEIFGPPEPPQDIPEEIPQDIPEPPQEPEPEPPQEPEQPTTINDLINQLSTKQRSAYNRVATKESMDIEEYLILRADANGFGDDFMGVKEYLEKKKSKKSKKK